MSTHRGKWRFRRVSHADNEAVKASSSSTTSSPWESIIFCAACLTVPMLLFTAVIIGLVYRYKVPVTTSSSEPALSIPGTEPEAGVYYVHLTSTVLVFIASWSSSLAPLLSRTAMYLVAYPVAKQLLDDTLNDKPDNMPTPKQFALMLHFLDGSAGAGLWSWWNYLRSWRRRRAQQSHSMAFPALMTLLFFTLSFLVFLADTWLHITTSSVNLAQLSILDQPPDYSLSLSSPACTSTNGSLAAQCEASYPCSVACPAYGPAFLGSAISTQVLNNVSNSMAVYSNAPDAEIAYIGIPDSTRRPDLDYTATTFGSKTQCRPFSSECNLLADAGSLTRFWCSDAWSGNLAETSPDVGWFADQSLQDNFTHNGILNPFYHGIGATLRTAISNNTYTIISNGQAVRPVHGGIAFLILCQTTIYDVEYDFVNSSVSRFVSTASNSTVANCWQSIPSDTTFDVAPYLSPILDLAVDNAETMQEIAQKVALSFNKVLLAIGSYTLVPTPAILGQQRSTILVTRMPQAPFFCLILANLLFVVLGIALTIFTSLIAASKNAKEIHSIASRLHITALVADRFESRRAAQPCGDIDRAFTESEGRDSMRIGISMTKEGGYSYSSWLPVSDIELIQVTRRPNHTDDDQEESRPVRASP